MSFGYNPTEVAIRFNDDSGNSLYVWAEPKCDQASYRYVSCDYSSGRNGTGRAESGNIDMHDNRVFSNVMYISNLISNLSPQRLEDAAKTVLALSKLVEPDNKVDLIKNQNFKHFFVPSLFFENTMHEGDHEWAWICESCATKYNLSDLISGPSGNKGAICLAKDCNNNTDLVYYLWDKRK